VKGRSLIEDDNKLREVVARLRKYRLKLQPEKFVFLRKEVNYLGHIARSQELEPNRLK
jgi:hypothetical protein